MEGTTPLEENALTVLRAIFAAFGFKEGDGDECNYDVQVKQLDRSLVLDVNADDKTASILIGKRATGLTALQRVFNAALYKRISEPGQQRVWVHVNGKQPDAKRLNGDGEHPAEETRSPSADGKRKVVTVIAPVGVDIVLRSE